MPQKIIPKLEGVLKIQNSSDQLYCDLATGLIAPDNTVKTMNNTNKGKQFENTTTQVLLAW